MTVKKVPVTVSVFLVRRMLAALEARGISPIEFLSAARIRPDIVDDETACVTAQQYSALLRALVEGLDDEAICTMSRPLKRGSFALAIRSAVTGRTLQDGIRRAAHTFHVLQDDVILEPARDGSLAGVKLRFRNANSEKHEFLHELLVRVFWRLFAWLIGGRLPILAFDLAFPDPRHPHEYNRVFPAARRYGASSTAMWFEASRCDNLICRDDEATTAFLKRSYDEVIVPNRDAGTSGRVRRFLQNSQPRWPDLSEVAVALHTSTSTLQRRLMMEGTSFHDLKDQLRRDVAVFRLRTSDVPCGVLADELGFSDSASFQRAFRRWMGTPPGVYQQKARCGQGSA